MNMMIDPRVVRGNTYSAKIVTSAKSEFGTGEYKRSGTVKRKNTEQYSRLGTPPPVDGRTHLSMQTENFLEELTDKPVEADAETQTSAFMDRPMSPLFVAATTGRDHATQIQPGDLFDFDLEVEPLLEVLVGKTIHVAMLELVQEEELEAIRRQQQEFEAVRNVELAEVQRLEAEARRKHEEKERRVLQEKRRVAERLSLDEKIAARAFSQDYLSSLREGVMSELMSEGYFYDPIKREVEEVYMVELLRGVANGADTYDSAQYLVEELLAEAAAQCKQYQRSAVQRREEERERQRREEEAQRKRAEEQAALEAAAAAAAQEEVDAPNEEE